MANLNNNFITQIIEKFEDFLDEKGIEIPNEDKVESENPSNIYGMDFGILMGDIRDICERNGVIVDDTWE